MLSNVSHLFVSKEPCWEAEVDMAEWLSFLRIFPAMEAMYASRVTAGYITSVLEDIPKEMFTKVLPALLLLYLDDDGGNDDRDSDDYNYDNIKPVGPTERFLFAPALWSPSTISILPDDVFREIFVFCLSDSHSIQHMMVWQSLVHVCQRWRQITFASPRYLDLHLYCSYRTPFRKNLSHWPEFPLTVHYFIPDDEGDLIAALKHPDRVRCIEIITSSAGREVFAAMQVPFPTLTRLELTGSADHVPNLPDRFLGGSTPCLQHLRLEFISFPELPTLLMSARDLVSLRLEYIPPVSYIPPEAMAEGLAALTRLRTLCIRFSSPLESPYERTGSRLERAVLPVLISFVFEGDGKYLEDLVAQLDAPRVEDVRIEYFIEEAEEAEEEAAEAEEAEQVQAGQLSQFIDRTENFKLSQFKRAQVTFYVHKTYIELDLPQSECHQAHLSIGILDPESRFSVPSLVLLLSQLVAMLSNVGHLSIRRNQCGMESAEWLPLLRLFSAVEVLEVSGGLTSYITSALEDTAEEMVTVSLPALQLLLLDEDNDKLERFLSLRRLSGRPVTIVSTRDEFVERPNSQQRR
ncbi:hypothetical protein EDB89DRAFT_2201182 [Lactarius sanguifluus]|nr:hypothetical protein EDB89DRAFT_2201182 [Lactarius sanguifluus]